LGRRTPTQTAWTLLREQSTTRGLNQCALLPAHSLQRLHWVAVLRSAAQTAVLVGGFLGRRTQTQTTWTLLREQPHACKQCVLLPAHGLQPRNASTSCVTCPTWQVKKKLKLRWRMLGPHQQLHFVIALAWAMQLARRRIVVASRRCSGVNNGDASAEGPRLLLILILMPRIPPPMKTPARQVRVTRLTALRQAALRRYVHRELWPRRRPRTPLNATCLCPAHGWLGCVLPHRQPMWPRRPPWRCRRS